MSGNQHRSIFHWGVNRLHSTPRPLYELRKSPKLIRPYAYCSLDKAVDAPVEKEKIAGEVVQERGT